MPDNDYSFIEEQIRPQKAKEAKKILKKLGLTAVTATIFGVFAACAFYITGNIIKGPESEEAGKEVSLVVATEEPDSTPAATHTVNESNDKSGKPNRNKENIRDFAAMYKSLSDYCKVYNSTIVTIAKIDKGTDYFENQIEMSSSFYGLVLQIDNNIVYVLTDYDELYDNSRYVLVLRDGSTVDAGIMGTDSLTGLAVMWADISELPKSSIDTIKVAEIGSSSGVHAGDLVVAIGNPTGKMDSIAYGLVCSEPESVYITDRRVNIFSSEIVNVEDGSGVVMNVNGKVVGIITHRFSSDMGLCNFMGINDLQVVIEQLMNDRSRAGIGIIPKDISSNYFVDKIVDKGIYVSDVYADTAAMDAGIVVGDIITKINGESIRNVADYMEVLASYSPYNEVEVEVYRDYASKNKIRTVTIVLDEVN